MNRICSTLGFLFLSGLFAPHTTACAQNFRPNMLMHDSANTALALLSPPKTFHERQTLIYHDGMSFVNAKGKSLPEVLLDLRKRPGQSGLTQDALKAAYLRIKESPIARIGSPEQSALSALFKLDLMAEAEWDRLQSLENLHKKTEASPYVPLHNRIWTLTEWPQFEQLSALDREISTLLSKLNVLKSDLQSEQAKRVRLIYGAHLVKSNGLSFKTPLAFNQYVDERTRLSFSPAPLRSFAKLVRDSVVNPDVSTTFYEGRGGKDMRQKTTTNHLHVMDVLNGNDNHSYTQQTAFRARYPEVAKNYNAAIQPYLKLQARALLRREGVEENKLHDIVDQNGGLLASPMDSENLAGFYKLYGGAGWDGAELMPYAGNTQVQTRWGRRYSALKQHYRAKSETELAQAARQAEWEQFGVDILQNIPFVGHLFGLTEATLTGQRQAIFINSLGLMTDYASVLVPSLLELKTASLASENVVSNVMRSAEPALEKRIQSSFFPVKIRKNAVPDEFSHITVGSHQGWTHPLTDEYLLVTRLVDNRVVALRSRAGGRYVPVRFSTGEPDFAKVVFKNQHGHFYRGGLRGGSKIPNPVTPLRARVDVSNRFQVYRIGEEYHLDYEPTRNHYLRAEIDEEGDFRFSIRSDPNTPELGSGQDMFIGVMKRMQKKGIKFKRIVTLWDAKADSKDSVNYASYAANRRAGMSSSKAAFKTWTGKRALEYGFDIVDDIDEDPDFVSISFSQSNPAPDKNASGCCGIQ